MRNKHPIFPCNHLWTANWSPVLLPFEKLLLFYGGAASTVIYLSTTGDWEIMVIDANATKESFKKSAKIDEWAVGSQWSGKISKIIWAQRPSGP